MLAPALLRLDLNRMAGLAEPRASGALPSTHAPKHVRDRLGFPLAPARRGNASPIESCRDLSERLRPYSLGFSNGRHDDVGVSVGASHLGVVGDDAGLGQPRIAKYLAASLGCSAAFVRWEITARSFSARAA